MVRQHYKKKQSHASQQSKHDQYRMFLKQGFPEDFFNQFRIVNLNLDRKEALLRIESLEKYCIRIESMYCFLQQHLGLESQENSNSSLSSLKLSSFESVENFKNLKNLNNSLEKQTNGIINSLCIYTNDFITTLVKWDRMYHEIDSSTFRDVNIKVFISIGFIVAGAILYYFRNEIAGNDEENESSQKWIAGGFAILACLALIKSIYDTAERFYITRNKAATADLTSCIEFYLSRLEGIRVQLQELMEKTHTANVSKKGYDSIVEEIVLEKEITNSALDYLATTVGAQNNVSSVAGEAQFTFEEIEKNITMRHLLEQLKNKQKMKPSAGNLLFVLDNKKSLNDELVAQWNIFNKNRTDEQDNPEPQGDETDSDAEEDKSNDFGTSQSHTSSSSGILRRESVFSRGRDARELESVEEKEETSIGSIV